jgi:hypothetical protein
MGEILHIIEKKEDASISGLYDALGYMSTEQAMLGKPHILIFDAIAELGSHADHIHYTI